MRTAPVQVIGNGPAGLATAIGLARQGWTVSVQGRRQEKRHGSRLDVLAGSALAMLERLGVTRAEWHRIAHLCPGTWTRWANAPASTSDHLMSPTGPSWVVAPADLKSLLLEKALTAGVRFEAMDPAFKPSWRVLATGRVGATHRDAAADYLVAITTVGPIKLTGAPLDRRLHIETTPQSWLYAISGCDQLCIGLITDATVLRGRQFATFATQQILASDRIRHLASRLASPAQWQAAPVPCTFRGFMPDPHTITVGDALASYDPLSGRGLWQALYSAERAAQALSATPCTMEAFEIESRRSYMSHLDLRRDFYSDGARYYQTGFWDRRVNDAETRASGPPGMETIIGVGI